MSRVKKIPPKESSRVSQIPALAKIRSRDNRPRRRLEHERPSQGAEVSDSQDVSEVVRAAKEVVQRLEAALEILQTAQSIIPAPTLGEVADMRLGKRPLTQEAYLIANLQRVLLGAENVVSDLRVID